MQYKIAPYDWQIKAIKKAEECNDLALFADMGTGKTGAVVNILRMHYGKNKRLMRTLIIGPLSVIFNWPKEIEMHSYINSKEVSVAYGTGKDKYNIIDKAITNPFTKEKNNNSIVVTNYDTMLNKECYENILLWQPEILVLDESHLVKSPKAKRTKAIDKLAQKVKHTYILTGTPIPNSITDIFMQFKILDKGETFGKNFFIFRSMFMHDVNAVWASRPGYFPKWEPRPDAADKLHEMIYKKAIRVKKSECLDLPPRVVETVHVPLSKEQQRLYDQMDRDLVAFINSEETQEMSPKAIAQLALTKALRLQQIISGHIKDDEGNIHVIADNPRLKITEELLESLCIDNKVIVWTAFKQNIKDLERVCDKLKIKHVKIVGKQSALEKQEAIDAFDSDASVRICLANRKAGGTGVNLIKAAYSINYSRDYSYVNEKQSEDRNYRGGSEIHEKIVKINLVSIGTLDEHNIESLDKKESMASKIIEIYRRKNERNQG